MEILFKSVIPASEAAGEMVNSFESLFMGQYRRIDFPSGIEIVMIIYFHY